MNASGEPGEKSYRAFPSCPLPLCSNDFSFKTIQYENVSLLQVLFHSDQTRFHKKGFVRVVVLKQRHKRNPGHEVGTMRDPGNEVPRV